MKKIIDLFKKIIKVAVIVAIIVAVGYAGYSIYQSQGESTVVENLPQETEYEERVDQKMTDTADEWKEKHRVWAEQEVSREIIVEQEQKLEKLREKELSL